MMTKKTICDRSEYSAIKLIFENHMLFKSAGSEYTARSFADFSLFNR